MKLDDTAKIDAMLESRLTPWTNKLASLIRSKVEDARAHAERALTDSARNAPDGRATLRRIEQNPSYRAALNRLDELLTGLVGPSKDSLRGLIRDARATFYEASVKYWADIIPDEYRDVSDPVATQEGESTFRGAIIHGYDLETEIMPSIDTAKRGLFVTLSVATRRDSDLESGTRQLEAWQSRMVQGIFTRSNAALSDSNRAIHHAVGLQMLREDLRPKDFPATAIHLP